MISKGLIPLAIPQAWEVQAHSGAKLVATGDPALSGLQHLVGLHLVA